MGSKRRAHASLTAVDVATTTLLAVSWVDSEPMLRVRLGGDQASDLVPLAGFALNYAASPDTPRVCVGHVPFRGTAAYYDCHKPPQPGGRTCERCSIVNATFASNLHHAHTRGAAELDPAIRDHLQQANRLYLAAFRDGSIKVGTSTQRRSQQRLEEQGAWMARYVALADNGYVVRDIEDAVTNDLGLTQAVNASRKVRGLISPVSDDRLTAELDSHAEAVGELIASSHNGRIASIDEPWRHPKADHPALRKLFPYPSKLISGGHDLELVTAVGRSVIARRPGSDDMFAFDLAPLFGLVLTMGDAVSDEITIQDSLF